MTRHIYQNRTFKKLESLSEKVGGILVAIMEVSILIAVIACLTLPIWMLIIFSETMSNICESIVIVSIYVSTIAGALYGFSYILTVIVGIVAGAAWECVWAMSKLLVLVRKQLANSFKV